MSSLYAEVWAYYGRGQERQFIHGLRVRMKQHRVSAADLARKSGHQPTHVSRWLSERVVPSLENKLILDEALDRCVAERMN